MDRRGYHYAVAGETNFNQVGISILGRNTDASVSTLFKGFASLPDSDDDLVESILGTLASRPLEEPNRFIKAIAWAAEYNLAAGTLTLTEVKSWFLFIPRGASYPSSDSLAHGSLCAIALKGQAYIGVYKGEGQSHVSAYTEPSQWGRLYGSTACGMQLEEVSVLPGYESSTLAIETLTADTIREQVTCPQCTVNAALLMLWNILPTTVKQEVPNPDAYYIPHFLPVTFWHDRVVLTGTGPDNVVDLEDHTTKSALQRVGIRIGKNLRVKGTATIYTGTIIGSNVTLGNNVCLGVEIDMDNDVTLEDDVTLDYLGIVREGCVIGKGSRVGEQCEVDERVQIGRGVVIGQCCEIHHDVQIGEKARIGDFVYLGKRLHIGQGQQVESKKRLTVNGEIQHGY